MSGEYSEVDRFYCNFMAGTGVESIAPAAAVILYQNFPNPFNPVTGIRFYLARSASVTLDIFDIAGRRVTRLVQGERGEGHHLVHWNGCAGDGTPVASGVYLSVLTTRGRSVSRKMILAR
ncbi:MAG TPA: FlgD immunoglobulin-like domain containing protein [Patescibacteria group bacterium]|nr:FlgD immunoglobulin-like domain containing protein [Patescibacteria group bacterium]